VIPQNKNHSNAGGGGAKVRDKRFKKETARAPIDTAPGWGRDKGLEGESKVIVTGSLDDYLLIQRRLSEKGRFNR